MSKADDEALADSIKFGSGPLSPVSQGSVEFGDKYGVAPFVVAEVEAKTDAAKSPSKSADTGDQKKES